MECNLERVERAKKFFADLEGNRQDSFIARARRMIYIKEFLDSRKNI